MSYGLGKCALDSSLTHFLIPEQKVYRLYVCESLFIKFKKKKTHIWIILPLTKTECIIPAPNQNKQAWSGERRGNPGQWKPSYRSQLRRSWLLFSTGRIWCLLIFCKNVGKKLILQGQDNTRAHAAALTRQKLEQRDWKTVEHLPNIYHTTNVHNCLLTQSNSSYEDGKPEMPLWSENVFQKRGTS